MQAPELGQYIERLTRQFNRDYCYTAIPCGLHGSSYPRLMSEVIGLLIHGDIWLIARCV